MARAATAKPAPKAAAARGKAPAARPRAAKKAEADVSVVVSVRMPESLHREVVAFADKEDRSLSRQITRWIDEGLRRDAGKR
jgi:hypothetical protein